MKREDGTFDLFYCGRLEGDSVAEDGLMAYLCVRWGYCQGEFDEIMREVHTHGRKLVMF